MSIATISTSTKQRILVSLFSAQSLLGAALIATFTVMPLSAVALSGSEATAGWPSTALLLGRAVGAYPAGWLMARSGRRLGLALGYLAAAVGFALGALSIIMQSFVGLCLSAALIGLGRAASDMSRYAAADVELPARKARAVSLIVLAGVVGAIVGPLLVAPAGRLAEHYGFDAYVGPYVLGIVLAFIAFVLTELLLRPDPMSVARTLAPASGAESHSARGRSVREMLHARRVQVAVAALVIGQLVMTLIMVITPLYMTHNAHGLEAISFVIMAHTLGMFALSSLTGRLVERIGAYTVILIGALILAVSTILAPLSSDVIILSIALFLLGLGWNLTFIAGSALLTVGLTGGEEGRIQGATDTMVALASGAGSLSTGLVFANGGMTAVSMMGLALTLAFGVLAVIAGQRRQLAAE